MLEVLRGLGGMCFIFGSLGHSIFLFGFKKDSFVLCTSLGLPHPLIIGFIHCICDYGLDLVGTHLFHWSHGGEQTTSHNVFRDVFAFIMKDVGFHVFREQIHTLPLRYFESFHW